LYQTIKLLKVVSINNCIINETCFNSQFPGQPGKQVTVYHAIMDFATVRDDRRFLGGVGGGETR